MIDNEFMTVEDDMLYEQTTCPHEAGQYVEEYDPLTQTFTPHFHCYLCGLDTSYPPDKVTGD